MKHPFLARTQQFTSPIERSAYIRAGEDGYRFGRLLGLAIRAEVEKEQLEAENFRLREENERDAKTKLLGFPAFKKRVENYLEAQSEFHRNGEADKREHKNRYGLMIADIDDFKKINTELGYQGADTICLIPTADIISDSLSRKNDLVTQASRFGGEEFVVFLDGTDLIGATEVGERIRSKVNEIYFDTSNGRQRLGISMGIASFGLDATFDEAFEAANYALQRAKEADGKNQIVTVQYFAPKQ